MVKDTLRKSKKDIELKEVDKVETSKFAEISANLPSHITIDATWFRKCLEELVKDMVIVKDSQKVIVKEVINVKGVLVNVKDQVDVLIRAEDTEVDMSEEEDSSEEMEEEVPQLKRSKKL